MGGWLDYSDYSATHGPSCMVLLERFLSEAENQERPSMAIIITFHIIAHGTLNKTCCVISINDNEIAIISTKWVDKKYHRQFS